MAKDNGTPPTIICNCANCDNWRRTEPGPGPVMLGEARGVCWAMPPQVVPFYADDGRAIIGQANLRPHTTEGDGCISFFVPRPDLLKPAANDPNLNG